MDPSRTKVDVSVNREKDGRELVFFQRWRSKETTVNINEVSRNSYASIYKFSLRQGTEQLTGPTS